MTTKTFLTAATGALYQADSGLRRIQNDIPAPLTTDLTQWASIGFGTSGSGVNAVIDRAGYKGTPALVKRWLIAGTDVGTNSGPNIAPAYTNGAPVAADNLPRVGTMWVEATDTPGDVVVQAVLMALDASTGSLTQQVGGQLFTIRANRGPQRIYTPVAKLPSGTVAVPVTRIWTSSQVGTGTVRVSAPQVEAATASGPFRHGDMAGASWAGTRNASSSVAMLGVTERLAGFGDSHMGQLDGGGFALSDYIAESTGRPVFPGGRGGETSTGVALRAGALTVTISVSGGSIPATTTSVPCSVTVSGTNPIFRSGASWSFVGEVGGVDGTLVLAADGTWSFTRTTAAGSATTVAANSPFTSYEVPDSADLWIIQCGVNLPDHDRVLYDIAAMVTRRRAVGRDFLILPLYNAESEPSGSTNYNLLMSINNDLAARYPQQFIDTRKYLINNGLAAAGITPLTADTTDIANDTIPSSLRRPDGIHLIPTGRQVVAAYIAQVLRARNVLRADAPLAPRAAITTGPQRIIPPASLITHVVPAAWFVTNYGIANVFDLNERTTMRYIRTRVGVQSGNIQAGVIRINNRDASFVYYTRTMNSGVIACPAAGQVKLDCGATVLDPGEYAVFLWADNTTVTLPHVFPTPNGALDGCMVLDLGTQASGIPASGNTGGAAAGYTSRYLSAITVTAF